MNGPWRKSSRSSGAAGGECVETRLHRGLPQLRDSKLGDSSPILTVSRGEFSALLGSLK